MVHNLSQPSFEEMSKPGNMEFLNKGLGRVEAKEGHNERTPEFSMGRQTKLMVVVQPDMSMLGTFLNAVVVDVCTS